MEKLPSILPLLFLIYSPFELELNRASFVPNPNSLSKHVLEVLDPALLTVTTTAKYSVS